MSLNNYALIKNGIVYNIVVSETNYVNPDSDYTVLLPQNSTVGIGWEYIEGDFIEPISLDVVQKKKIFTKFEFRSLFTIEELIFLDNSDINENLSIQEKMTLKTILKNFDAASIIDIENPATIFGINYLKDIGLLSEERAEEILST
jgi:phage pi2 protein 07